MLPEIIASMTSYPARIDTVHLAVESLLRQTVRADRVILWLADVQFPGGFDSLPEPLKEQTKRGLTIRWCDDLRSYKRQYYAFRDYPYAAIIIVDDDLVYPPDMIETLCSSFERHPDAVSAMRVHLMRFDKQGGLMPYNSWYYEYSGLVDVPSMALYATPGGGTLVPPGVMHEAAFDLDNIKRVCPTADDIWMKLMYTLTNTPVVLAAENRPLVEIPETQEFALWRDNCVRNESDRQRAALLEKYDKTYGDGDTLVGRMFRDAGLPGKTGPALSVVLAPCEDICVREKMLGSVLSQDFEDMEILVTDECASSENRVRRVSCGRGIMAAISAATLRSRGDYVLYLMPGETLEPDACGRLIECIRGLETDSARLRYDILDTAESGEQELRGAAICSQTPWDKPENALSGKLMRGALCRLALRFVDVNKYPQTHPAAAAFIASICAKGYHRCEMKVVRGDGRDLGGNEQAVQCAAEFLHTIGGEEAYCRPFGDLCSGLSGEGSAVCAVGSVFIGALDTDVKRREDIKIQLAEAQSLAEQQRSAISLQSRQCDASNRRVRELERQLTELRESTIFKSGRLVTWLPRKCKKLMVRLLKK